MMLFQRRLSHRSDWVQRHMRLWAVNIMFEQELEDLCVWEEWTLTNLVDSMEV